MALEASHVGQTGTDDAQIVDAAVLVKTGVLDRQDRVLHDFGEIADGGQASTLFAELDRALSYDPDYVALGPIYPTLLKQMPWAPQGLERIGEWKTLVGARPLVAIGGLTLERAILCLKAGADSAAVVTDVVRAEDPEARAKEWIAATR